MSAILEIMKSLARWFPQLEAIPIVRIRGIPLFPSRDETFRSLLGMRALLLGSITSI